LYESYVHSISAKAINIATISHVHHTRQTRNRAYSAALTQRGKTQPFCWLTGEAIANTFSSVEIYSAVVSHCLSTPVRHGFITPQFFMRHPPNHLKFKGGYQGGVYGGVYVIVMEWVINVVKY